MLFNAYSISDIGVHPANPGDWMVEAAQEGVEPRW